MEFIPEQEVVELLNELGITSQEDGDAGAHLAMDSEGTTACDCLCSSEQSCQGDGEWMCHSMDAEKIIESVVGTIHKIHEGQTVLIPSCKWRTVFDAVAFSMAEDESWQEFDASATIKLNTRDPLLFEGGDEHTLTGLITALMNDGEGDEQGVFLITAGAPILMHIQPCGPVKLWFGNSALADEVREHYAR